MERELNHLDTIRGKKRSLTLAMVAFAVLVGTGTIIASWKQGRRFGMQHLAVQPEQQNWPNFLKGLPKVSVGEDGWATSQTGVYYLPSDPSKCFIIRAIPHGAQRGWALLPSDAMAGTMISAFGWVAAMNPPRGKVMLWNSAKVRKQVGFVYFGTWIVIGGVKYPRRPRRAPWQCKPQFTTKTPYLCKYLKPQNCQWIVWNKKTTGFVIYYAKWVVNTIAAGGGYLDAAKGEGVVSGYQQLTGRVDGPTRLVINAHPPSLQFWRGGARVAGGKYDFIQLATCADPGYPRVTQLLSGVTKAPRSVHKPACPNPSVQNNLVPIYSFFRNVQHQHVYTRRLSSVYAYLRGGKAISRQPSTPRFYVSSRPGAGLVPLYMYWKVIRYGLTGYMLSPAARAPANYRRGGLMGYVATQPICGSIPLYQWYLPTVQDYYLRLINVYPSRGVTQNRGILCYVWGKSPNGPNAIGIPLSGANE